MATIITNRVWATQGGKIESGTKVADVDLAVLPIKDQDGKKIKEMSPSVRMLADGIANGLFVVQQEPSNPGPVKPVEESSPEEVVVAEAATDVDDTSEIVDE